MRITISDHKLRELLQFQNQLAAAQDAPPKVSGVSETRQFAKDPLLGKFLQRILFFEHFNIAFLCWQLDQELEIVTDKLSSTVNMHFMLSGGIYSEFQSLPNNIRMKNMEHNLLFTSDSTGMHRFPSHHLLQNLHISLSAEYFRRICTADSKMTDLLLNHVERQSPVLASAANGTVTRQMVQTIQSMMECPFTGAVQQLYLEAKILELLALQLHNLEQSHVRQDQYKANEITLAEEIKLYLEQHYLDLFNLQQLARHFTTNEFKLKKVFRERFGGGIFAYAQQLRLEHAREQLCSGDKSVTEVAELLGYSHVNHFSNAFRKHFGYPPSQCAGKVYRKLA